MKSYRHLQSNNDYCPDCSRVWQDCVCAVRRFPFLHSYDARRRYPDWPASVPWKLIAPHEAQAVKNHSQSLRTLASRGGLSVLEMYAVLMDRDYFVVERANIDADVAMREIMRLGGLELKRNSLKGAE